MKDYTRSLKSKLKSSKWKKYYFLVIFLFVNINLALAQLPIATITECGCLNNETFPGNGQFSESIKLMGPAGVVWRVESAVGYYSTTSPAPPGLPIPIMPNTVLTESPAGTYTLNGRRIDNTNWTVNIVNAAGTLRYNLRSVHTCRYPKSDIIGDFGACIDSELKTYNIDMPNNMLSNVVWSISGGGLIVGPITTNKLVVNWGSTVGNYNINLTGLARAYPGQATGLCNFTETAVMTIANETAQALACNDLVTISMNGNCEMSITPDMVLEGMLLPESSYNVVLRDIQKDTIIPNRKISQKYINKIIEAKVVQECGGNSCWGLLKLEDKSIPNLICKPDITIDCDQNTAPTLNDFPLKPDAIIAPYIVGGVIVPNKFLIKNFDYCSDVILEYVDQVVGNSDCDGDISSIIMRTWIATDISGNKSSCVSKIFIRKGTIEDVIFPPNYDDVLGPNPSLPACGSWPKLPDGHPDPIFTGSPQGVFCMNANVTFTDKKLPACIDNDKTYKLIRQWTVSDLCGIAPPLVHTQIITVMDNVPPVVMAPPDFTVGTEGLTCASPIKVPKPKVTNECSKWDYVVSYKVPDDSGNPSLNSTTVGVIRNPDSTYTILTIPPGVTRLWVVYTVTDACGLTTEVFNEVNVKDSTPPVPVCDQFTFAGLNSEGMAIVTTESLDDGSWDNCGLEKLEAALASSNVFSDKLKFTCNDAGKSFMVVLRAVDKAGNTNSCMVEVRVQDNTPPKLENCPKDVTVGCNADLLNLAQYGKPTVSDLCGATLKEDVNQGSFDECGRGSVLRTFTATDASGNTSVCTQTITVRPTNTFNGPTWPGDHTFTSNGCSTNVDPDNMPAGKQRPTGITNISCALIAVDYDDLVFQYVEGFCFKILRKWTVIDWCQYVPATPTTPAKGIYIHTQVIKGMNTIAPTITKGCAPADIKVSQIDNCKALIEATAIATDDCTPEDKLVWAYTIDVDNNGSIDFSGNTNTFARQVNFGKHTIKWTVSDECGNSKTCTTMVEVKDQKKPTPYCLSEINTVIMEEDGTVEIWASDFNAGSFDNCSQSGNLKFSFTSNTSTRSRVFNCDSMTSKVTRFTLRIYVTDDAGNQDYCTTHINVQDNNNTCSNLIDNTTGNNKASVAGVIKTENLESVTNVKIQLTSEQTEFPKYYSTDDLGTYSFGELNMNKDYLITPSKQDDYLNGVTTLDLVMIQRHILGVKTFTSPYKIIAADANSDNKVSANDLVALRKLILGLTETLPGEYSWKFVDKAYTFTDINRPFPYNQYISMQNLDHSVEGSDFVGIKVGDVNDSYQKLSNEYISENRSRSILQYQVPEAKANKAIEIPFYAEDSKIISGVQLSLLFDDSKFEFAGIKEGSIAIRDEDVNLYNSNNIIISHVSKIEEDLSGRVFTLLFRTKKDIKPYEFINKGNGFLRSEYYTNDDHDNLHVTGLDVELRNKTSVNNQEFELFQNTPNPFNNNTTIAFILPESGEVSFKVYDYSGTILKQFRKHYEKGYNTIDLNVSELNKTGLLFYQLDSKTHSANKKMIVIK